MDDDSMDGAGGSPSASPREEAAAETAPLIELRGVERVHPAPAGGEAAAALAGVSLRIEAGEFVCVTGPSGSGKTTLLNVLGCLDRPTAGACRIAGRDAAALSADERARLRRETFGFVFQQYSLIESATARENVELPAAYAGLPRGERRRRARDLLGFVGLGGRLESRPAELSGGERQRVAVARALVNGARAILADEPTGALDAEQGGEVLDLLERLAAAGRAVVVVSHDAGVAARAGRRVALRDGRVVEDSGPAAGGAFEPGERRRPAGAGMAWLTALRGGLSALRGGRLRAALTVCSVALGIWSAAALLGLAEGARRDAVATLERMGANRLVLQPFYVVDLEVRRLTMTLADARAVAEQVGNVRSVVPLGADILPVRAGERAAEISVSARDDTEPRTTKQNLPWPVERGAYITQRDSDEAALVAVIGPRARNLLFDPVVDPVGESVEIKGLRFVVKGVLADRPPIAGEGESFSSDEALAEQRGIPYQLPAIHVPFRTGFELLFGTDGINRLDVYVEDVSRIDETMGDIQDLMVRRHGPGRYVVVSEGRIVSARKELSGTYMAILGAVGGVALLAGGFGVLSAALASVAQRRREIGIRMAVGARPGDVSRQFLVETAVLATVGGALGVLLAVLGSPLLSRLASAPVAFAPWFVPAALGCAVAVGLAFGIVPARRAARLDPATALASD